MTTINSTTDIRVWLDNQGHTEHLTADEVERVVELLVDGERRPAWGDDWTEYLDSSAQAFVFEVATGYDEDEEPTEPVLTAIETDGTWAVDDAVDGGRWFPGDDAADEIAASNDPAVAAVRICRETPMRGTWRY